MKRLCMLTIATLFLIPAIFILIAVLSPTKKNINAEYKHPFNDPAGYKLFHSKKIEYPYHASKKRSKEILKGIKSLKKGLTTLEVRNLLSAPDEINPTYKYIKNSKVQGWSYVYIIRRITDSGSFNDKNEKLIRIHFNLSGKLISAYGVDIPEFKEIKREL